jgi:phosphoglycolate phosphatase
VRDWSISLPMTIELVMFDADGVLFDSGESNTAYYNAIFAAIGEPPLSPEEERNGVFHATSRMFADRAAGDLAKLARMKEVARKLDSEPFFRMLRPPFELRPFMLQLKRRYRLGLATNRSTTVPALIAHLGLEGIFDAVASAHDKVEPKPAPDIVQLCIDRAGADRRRSVYVGDSPTDLEAALGAGTNFIAMGERVSYQPRLSHLSELPTVLERFETVIR